MNNIAFLRSILIFLKIDIYKCPKIEKPKKCLENACLLTINEFYGVNTKKIIFIL